MSSSERTPETSATGTTSDQRVASPGELATPSALPPLWRRILAFFAIIVGGVCGALIGYGFGDITCASSSCTTATGAFTLIGAVVGAGGVAIVAILALRAMDEWESLGSQRTRIANRQQPR